MVLDEEAQARADVWKYTFGFINIRVVTCAVELQIPDVLEKLGAPISLAELSSAVGVPADALYRIMRFLVYHGIFKKTEPPQSKGSDDDWILHDWSDKACIDILKKCGEAVSADTGKVMIVDAVVDEEGEGDEYNGARLSLDMIMMAVTVQGRERTYREWAQLLNAAGFSRHTVKNIKIVESVIEAYP